MKGRENGRRAVPSDDVVRIIRLIYRRVSKKEMARDGLSLGAQLRACQDYCARQRDWLAGEEYDDVQTGRVVSRKGYQALLTAVRAASVAGTQVVVVVARVDRLGRDLEESTRAWKELEKLGAVVHSVREGGVVTWQTFHILAFIAEDETRRISDRVKAVWADIEQQGWHRPGRVAWGYTYRPATREERGAGAPRAVLVPDPIQARYARELWQRRASGESTEALIRWAAALPEAARGTVGRADGAAARALKGSAIRAILSLPVYVGRLGGAHDLGACADEGGRCEVLDRPRGAWEPLIEDEVWEQAHEQYRLARRLPAQASGRYLLTGLLRCHACGGRMVGNPGNRKRAERDGYRGDPADLRRYVCSERLHGDALARAAPCYATVLGRKIEAPVLGTVRELLARVGDPDLRVRVRTELQREIKAAIGADDDAGLIAGLEKRLRETHAILAAASRAYFAGDINKLAYQVNEEQATREAQAIEDELVRLRARGRQTEVMPPETMLRLVDSLGGVARGLDEVGAVDPVGWRGVVEAIVAGVRPVRQGRGVYEVALELTPFGRGLLDYVCRGTVTPNLVAVQQLATTNWWTATIAAAS